MQVGWEAGRKARREAGTERKMDCQVWGGVTENEIQREGMGAGGNRGDG